MKKANFILFLTDHQGYGGTAGALKGHKFSLYEGGIRVPALISWPERIPAGQIIAHPADAMDIFPTFLHAAGGDPSQYEIDGHNLLPLLADGALGPQRDLFWEMDDQTAIRRGIWKLELNGRLVEGAPAEDTVHLSNLETDMGERHSLKDEEPTLTTELTAAAEAWRAGIEASWKQQWQPAARGRRHTRAEPPSNQP